MFKTCLEADHGYFNQELLATSTFKTLGIPEILIQNQAIVQKFGIKFFVDFDDRLKGEKIGLLSENEMDCFDKIGKIMNIEGKHEGEFQSSLHPAIEVYKKGSKLIFANASEILSRDLINHKTNQRFRPEFSVNFGSNLPFLLQNENEEKDEIKLIHASKYLIESIIPKFVQSLDKLELVPLDIENLSLEMHRAGINNRYLGILYTLTNSPYVKDLVGVSMIARTLKCFIREMAKKELSRNGELCYSVQQKIMDETIALLEGFFCCSKSVFVF